MFTIDSDLGERIATLQDAVTEVEAKHFASRLSNLRPFPVLLYVHRFSPEGEDLRVLLHEYEHGSSRQDRIAQEQAERAAQAALNTRRAHIGLPRPIAVPTTLQESFAAQLRDFVEPVSPLDNLRREREAIAYFTSDPC